VGQTLNIPEGEPNILSNLSDWVGAEVNEIKTSAIGLATATEGIFDHVTDSSLIDGLVTGVLEYAGLKNETNTWDALTGDPSLKSLSDDDKKNILKSVLEGDASNASYGDYLELSGLKEAALDKDATALDKLKYHAELALSTKGTDAGDELSEALLENPRWIGTAINGGKTNGAYDDFMSNVETNFYNQFTQVGNIEARTATYNNGERDVTLNWNPSAAENARAADNPDTDAKYTTDEAIRKTGFKVFDALLKASFESRDVTSVNIEGGWRVILPFLTGVKCISSDLI
jgi:hypothetical protein